MVKAETATPVVQRPERLERRSGSSAPAPEGAHGCAPALQAERLGLLARPAVSVDGERRIEDWIASNLELDLPVETMPRTIWDRLIGHLPSLRRGPSPRRREGDPETAVADWTRFRIAYKRGITVVRLVDRALVKESQVRELASDLLDLIEAGNSRIVLNFHRVERLASWVVVLADEAHRRCQAADGGALKLCGLEPHLAAIFAIAGVGVEIECHPDETAALESPWPEPSRPRALPVEILLALTAEADVAPLCGGAPSQTAETPGPRLAGCSRPTPPTTATAAAPSDATVSLLVQIGGTAGRAVAVGGPRFLIGRGRDCHLRLGSAMVSKRHAAIERRDGRIVLRDLGSTNGTVVNGRVLRRQGTDLHDGDRIQIGPVVCTLGIRATREPVPEVDAEVLGWLPDEPAVPRPDPQQAQPDPQEAQPTDDFPTLGLLEDDPASALRCEHQVIQDVLVVTPRGGDLDNDNAIGLLRSRLWALFQQPLPRQVVVNLEYVGHLSGQAVGVLLAHHLRLDRAGGALRITQARARIMAALHQVRLTMLVECHPTLDEAVLSAWPGPVHRVPAENAP
ncbi:MAG TPA: FHA domain-containing protein [Isosphaeraceae bacterium]|nr:FHA domain-containing protein [Isosphaeraceae bacterium]